MTLEAIQQDALARELGLLTDDWEISERGLAALLRLPLSRWGLTPKAAVLRYARDQLDAAGLRDRASSQLPNILRRLAQIGECAEFSIGHQRYIAPTPPRWIRTSQTSAALLSVAPNPKGIVEEELSGSADNLVRRIRVDGEDDLATLRIAGVREVSLDEWLRPHGYLDYGRRRVAGLIRSDKFGLSEFWTLIVSTVMDQGLPLGDDAKVRAVVGEPGGYFGKYNSEQCEGRWSELPTNGVWCAYRRGYGPNHWQPIVLAVDGYERRSMDLHDNDEWRWALVARGKATECEERVDQVDEEVKLTFPPPTQLATAMDLLGPRRGAWSWTVAPAAPDPWSLLR